MTWCCQHICTISLKPSYSNQYSSTLKNQDLGTWNPLRGTYLASSNNYTSDRGPSPVEVPDRGWVGRLVICRNVTKSWTKEARENTNWRCLTFLASCCHRQSTLEGRGWPRCSFQESKFYIHDREFAESSAKLWVQVRLSWHPIPSGHPYEAWMPNGLSSIYMPS